MSCYPLVAALLLDTLDDLERSLTNLTDKEAEAQPPGLSSIGWTVGHLAQHLDSWVVAGLSKGRRNEYLAAEDFSRGGTGGPPEWMKVKQELFRTLQEVRSFLRRVSAEDLTQQSEYSGSIDALKGKSITPAYRLVRLVTHIYYHIGEINAVQSSLGATVGDYPGLLFLTLEATTSAKNS